MLIKAALLRELGQPLTVEEVDLAPPERGEVLVKMVAAGLCHTDLGAATRDIGIPVPLVLGHEGAGTVVETGPDVSDLAPGDPVILTGAAACGHCPRCLSGQPTICDVYRAVRFGGTLAGGQHRLSQNGQPLGHFFFQASFAEYAVVPADAAIKIRADAPLDVVCYLGCGGLTGIGAVLNSAALKPGQTVAVHGCGSVGLSAVMGAHLGDASRVVAVDVLQNKLDLALEVGASHAVNAAKEDAVAQVRAITGGGADVEVIAMNDRVAITRVINEMRVGATCVLVGSPGPDHPLEINPLSLLREKVIRGCTLGSGLASDDIPRYVDLFMASKLPLHKLVTRRYTLDQINLAFNALLRGEVVKAVITF